MSVLWLDKKELVPTVKRRLHKADVVLDIGCGIRPQNFITPNVHICCEPFDQYVDYLQKNIDKASERSVVILKATWGEAVKIFPAGSVDTIFLNDVIEHLEKEEALQLLKASETIARRQIAIFTPLGFMPQSHPDGKDAWGLDGGAWQEHKSGWQPEDFDDSWEIFVTKEYHKTDSLGRELEVPFGAMWAIKSNPAANPPPAWNKWHLRSLFARKKRLVPKRR